MFTKDFEGEAEWWRDDEAVVLPGVKFYLRLETDDCWTWYRLADYSLSLFELDEAVSNQLEDQRNEKGTSQS